MLDIRLPGGETFACKLSGRAARISVAHQNKPGHTRLSPRPLHPHEALADQDTPKKMPADAPTNADPDNLPPRRRGIVAAIVLALVVVLALAWYWTERTPPAADGASAADARGAARA